MTRTAGESVEAVREGGAVAPPAEHPGGVRPLLDADHPVLVDGHPICQVCGTAVEPMSAERWRHLPKGRRFTGRSKWLAPLSLKHLPTARTYAEFKARFSSPVRLELGRPFTTSEVQWREGVRRLEHYQAGFKAFSQRRTLHAKENPCLDLFGVLTAPPLPPGLAQMLDLPERRRELAALFSWAIPTDEALDALARYAPLVECGAGMGYWTALLRAHGVEVVAYDAAPPGPRVANTYHGRGRRPWARIHRGSSVAAVRRHQSHTLMLCWPPYEDDTASYATLRAYRGDVAIYIGEPGEGATGSVRFHRELSLNWTVIEQVELPNWPRLRDRLLVYRRNGARRPHRARDHCFECQRFIRTGGIGRCDWCFERRPLPLAVRVGAHRVEYSQPMLESMPAALRTALEESPNRVPQRLRPARRAGD